uniref:Uncharacterized protein n=1 Tax=Molossus molossus TaxID=27622 RepID=A0A7J8IXM8_MOLMO|nr:hypothetical protein HJG59_004842 [Molossus molossus]
MPGGQAVPAVSATTVRTSGSSHYWRESYRRNCPRGPVWCQDASPFPPGSLWLW